ncbi:MAG: 2-C-methyl-D-erythritol 4-phosphate cytidylyltransferase [Bacteroidales bacterium]|nr:2-C-methyl-D-erythritol 4-phosphate cytidylyltransferase [Bacteroidales bacterium]
MERKKFLIVTAGGMGTRMGGPVPKQFIELEGKPILRLTIERFLEAVPDLQIITVLPEAYITTWRQYCIKADFTCPQRLVKGGFTRFHSVKNALAYVPDGALVAVHDGVRPLLSIGKIRELFAKAQTVPALIPVMPATDTLKVLEKKADGSLAATGESIDRSRIFGAQTPQLFYSELLKQAYGQGFDTLFTDDASVAEKYGIPLTFIEGERFNLKITTPEDLVLAKAILEMPDRA